MFRPEEARDRYWRQVRELADKHEVPVSEARTMWRRIYKKGGIKRLLLALIPSKTATTICPYCRDELPVFHDHEDACYQCGTFLHPEPDGFHCEPEPVWDCPGCNTSMHQECFDELGKCTTLGCRARATRPRVTATRRIVQPINEFLDELDRLPENSLPPAWLFVVLPLVAVGAVGAVIAILTAIFG